MDRICDKVEEILHAYKILVHKFNETGYLGRYGMDRWIIMRRVGLGRSHLWLYVGFSVDYCRY